MLHRYLAIASTPAVRAEREHYGSQSHDAAMDGSLGSDGPARNDRLGSAEAAFIAARDGFYLGSVSATGWPYVQCRGGPPGFLQVLDETSLGFADLRGNRQYITTGNIAGNDRVALFLMDYARRRRLKICGRMKAVSAGDAPELASTLAVPGYPARVERAVTIEVVAFDWNCAQHIAPRLTESELAPLLEAQQRELADLRAANAELSARLAAWAEDAGSSRSA